MVRFIPALGAHFGYKGIVKVLLLLLRILMVHGATIAGKMKDGRAKENEERSEERLDPKTCQGISSQISKSGGRKITG
jgi:hypothetical protein